MITRKENKKIKVTSIHIPGIFYKSPEFKVLYKNYLQFDPLWHFVSWGNAPVGKNYLDGQHIYIRITDDGVLRKIREHLNENHIYFEEYPYYPVPNKKHWWQLGQRKNNWEVKYQDIALLMDHLCSEAAVQMSKKEWHKFYSQFLHIAANKRGMDHFGETYLLMYYARDRLIVAEKWGRNNDYQHRLKEKDN